MDIYQLRKSENICFKLDDQKLKEIDEAFMTYNPAEGTGDILSAAIRDADSSAVSGKQMEGQLKPPKEYFDNIGNRYTGRGLKKLK
ncbi:MAG TPA: hypothetical protein VNI77_12360 [Nitrososphaera sp.]|nr:hypothetical protein [Nitrososphaera sp.]